MSPESKKKISLLLCALALASVSCSKVGRESSPVLLTVTANQLLNRIDLVGGTTCSGSLGTLSIQAQVKPNASTEPNTTPTTLNDVQITSYTVSYVRTDGGKSVPSSFTRSISVLVTTGTGPITVSSFTVFEGDATTRAPFAALLPQNGGRDPDTGRALVEMDVVITVFGQTLAGDKLSATTRFPIDFCYNCGGCA